MKHSKLDPKAYFLLLCTISLACQTFGQNLPTTFETYFDSILDTIFVFTSSTNVEPDEDLFRDLDCCQTFTEILPYAADHQVGVSLQDSLSERELDSLSQVPKLTYIDFYRPDIIPIVAERREIWRHVKGITIGGMQNPMNLIPVDLLQAYPLKALWITTSRVTLDSLYGYTDELSYLTISDAHVSQSDSLIDPFPILSHLELSSVKGEVPSTLIYHPNLQTLAIRHVPSFVLSSEIGNLQQLTHLEIMNRYGMDSIPAALMNCTQLTSLHLRAPIRYIPPGLEKLRNLTFLRLYQAQAEFPAEIAQLPKLKTVELALNCEHTSECLMVLSAIDSLERIAVRFNTQDSVIVLPDSMNRLSKLSKLTLNLDGIYSRKWGDKSLVIPSSFSQIPALTYFSTMVRITDWASIQALCDISSLKTIELYGLYDTHLSELSATDIRAYVQAQRPDITLKIYRMYIY